MNLPASGAGMQGSACARSPSEEQLFARYVKALALLCECHPYVDEPDFEELIDGVLREARSCYSIDVRQVDGRYELALRSDGPSIGA